MSETPPCDATALSASRSGTSLRSSVTRRGVAADRSVAVARYELPSWAYVGAADASADRSSAPDQPIRDEACMTRISGRRWSAAGGTPHPGLWVGGQADGSRPRDETTVEDAPDPSALR